MVHLKTGRADHESPPFSSLPDGWFVGARGGSALLRQLSLRYRYGPRTFLILLVTSRAARLLIVHPLQHSQNGNLTNTRELRPFLDSDAHRHINTDSDSELLLNILANNLQKTGKFRINEEDIFTAIRDLMSQVSGAYACTTMIAGFGLIAFRDPNGIRPVGLAQRDGAKGGKDYLFASESICADALGFTDWQDVGPGEAVIATRSGISRRQCAPPKTFAPDIFEYVYFARPDSTIDGISVYRSRMAMGDLLAEEVRKQLEIHGETIDVVIPVPETSRVAALQVAQRLQLPYREGFIKNRYVGRTFIMPGQQMRCVYYCSSQAVCLPF